MKTSRPDLPGAAFGLLALVGFFCGAFVIEKANRIVPGFGLAWYAALPGSGARATVVVFLLTLTLSGAVRRPLWRFAWASSALVLLCGLVGVAAQTLVPPDDRVMRVMPGVGFWLAAAACGLLIVDAVASSRPNPWQRVLLVAVAVAAVALALRSGFFDRVSVMREYAVNAPRFAQECQRHLLLAGGSLLVAVACALPIGVLGFVQPTFGRVVRLCLSAVQTIPSIALYGVLMAPLAALVAAFPVLAKAGIGGIGYAPALIALFLYALFPIVSNTMLGLERIDPLVVEAARGMGLTESQVLWQIRWPLALPTVLTGIRVVLVQNIGLAAVAALVGGGGLGTFIFQGIGQTAVDLVLLGALPTVTFALVAGVLLDALVDAVRGRRAA